MINEKVNINDIKMGIYRHYKGPLYQVEGVAHDANADTLLDGVVGSVTYEEPLNERFVVVYTPLQLDGAHLGPRKAVRTVDDFCGWAEITPEQRTVIDIYNAACVFQTEEIGLAFNHDGTIQARRFTHLGMYFAAYMAKWPT